MIHIDTHAHVFSKHDQCIETARYIPDYDATAEQFLTHLDKHGHTHGVLVQPSFFGTDNQVMLDAISQYPERLKGIAVVDRGISFNELSQLKTKGIIGARINLFGLPVPDFTLPEWTAFFSNLEQVNFQIELHAPPAYLVQVLPVLNNFKLDIVIDHFGRCVPDLGVKDPDYEKFLDLLDVSKHWIKVSGFYRLGAYPENIATAKESYALLKNKGFLGKMVWGSDWPHTQHENLVDYEKTVEAFQQIVPEAEEQELILGQNAAKLFHF
ncbi:amidohydrolase family protein [Acinetobacter tianfuensis]|uniref:Hydrolase n=1 Tax=Acinetobacter tianfuensis TaxID=2419603 RepID=A0A3A8E6S3_9GAMM|nr:amidohydrolase family protein [Acinetobacter tianfuensis]RKG29869.1 hydrolase [Acinetobacter tianfuensis]